MFDIRARLLPGNLYALFCIHTSIIWLMNISPSHYFALSCLSYDVILFTLYRSVIYTMTTPIIAYFVFSYFLPRTSILVLYEDTRTYMCYSLLKSLHMCVVLLHVLMNSFTLTSYERCGDLWNIFTTLLYFLLMILTFGVLC